MSPTSVRDGIKKETSECTSLAKLNTGVTGPKFTKFTKNITDKLF